MGGPDPAARRCERGRRVASSAPISGTNSVWTNRFWKAGCATSAACGASTISAYEVSSISRAMRAEVRQRHAADLGVVLGRHDDRQRRADERAVAPGELGTILGVDDLVGVGLDAARLMPADQTSPLCMSRRNR